MTCGPVTAVLAYYGIGLAITLAGLLTLTAAIWWSA